MKVVTNNKHHSLHYNYVHSKYIINKIKRERGGGEIKRINTSDKIHDDKSTMTIAKIHRANCMHSKET